MELKRDTFSPHVGETFELTPGQGEPFEAVLSSCEATPYGAAEDWLDIVEFVPFSLIFHAPDPSQVVPQQTIAVRHPELGELELFLVPIGPDERGMGYQAVIS